ncbi:glycosyltransferase family 2 protein [Priestia megaterium]|uniref:glycosyltransferase family 2 protein n=1 Tax=Priestia megaterium TaxID=1404 RepID=UPI00101B8B7B|nr:glycosyltransferase family 2 protein [Priestia megaterium]
MNSKDSPLVSVITPSYNQASFIKETIESVLTQDYPNIEYIVIDGGSNDGTLEILRSYRSIAPCLNFVSEPDRGQSHAINKGLKMAKGKIIGWLNSDDTYHPHAIRKAVEALKINPHWGMVYGKAYATDKENKVLHPYPVESFNKNRLFERCIICQPAAFIRKEVFEGVNGVDESFFFCMDYELWMRIAKKYEIGYIETYLANSRCHDLSKTTLYWKEVGITECMVASLKNNGTISNMMIYDFVNLNREKGVEWIAQQIKPFEIFGATPKIIKMNIYDDFRSPNCLDISVKINPNKPLHALLIKGKDIQPDKNRLTVSLNGKLIEEFFIVDKTFTLMVLIPSENSDCSIRIITSSASESIEKQQNDQPNNLRECGFLVDNIIPLSEKEYEFIQILYKKFNSFRKWLKENRKINLFNTDS